MKTSKSLGFMLGVLMTEGVKKRHILYNICFRRAGVAIEWSRSDLNQNKQWKETLYIDKYYDDIKTAINNELERIKKL